MERVERFLEEVACDQGLQTRWALHLQGLELGEGKGIPKKVIVELTPGGGIVWAQAVSHKLPVGWWIALRGKAQRSTGSQNLEQAER